MAKKEKPIFNYAAELKRLKDGGLQRLYILYGPEDYLRECFLGEMLKLSGLTEEDFSYKRFNGPALDMAELTEAVDAMPFFSDCSFVEVRDCDLGKCRDEDCERLKKIISDIPDYCTLVFTFSPSATPDGRTAAMRALKKTGCAIEFSEQEQGALSRWVQSRFRAQNKMIAPADAEYLIFLGGTRMNALIPEIEKISSFAQGDTVTRADIDATATRIPEADVFNLTDLLAQRRYDAAAALLSDLLDNKENHPILLTALIGQQMRRLYAAKLGKDSGCAKRDVMELCDVRYDFVYDKLCTAARPFTAAQLGECVKLCAEYDYKMKSTGQDAYVLIRELFARLATVS